MHLIFKNLERQRKKQIKEDITKSKKDCCFLKCRIADQARRQVERRNQVTVRI
jgi:hypothetical protein